MSANKFFILFSFLIISTELFGQNYISPYSRYGLGDLQSTHLLRHRAMGGTSIAAMDNNTFSLSNPASYGRINSFILETGVSANIYDLEYNNQRHRSYDFQLPYLSFSLPLLDTVAYKRGWGLNVSLTPFSKTGYQSTYKSDDVISRTETFIGTGGFSKFSIGTSFELFNNFFIGGNVGYLFGQQRLRHIGNFSDAQNAYDLERSTRLVAGGLIFDAGIIKQFEINKTNSLQFGVTTNLPGKINARQEENIHTYGNGYPVSDSILNRTTEKGDIFLPMGIGGGLQFTSNNAWDRDKGKDNSFTFAADVYNRKWSEFSKFGKTDSVTDYTSFSGGIEWKPNSVKTGISKTNTYFRKVQYRLGAKYATGIYNVGGVLPIDKSISFGLGLPYINRQTGSFPSFLDFTVEAGELIGNTPEINLARRYLIFSVSMHLSERGWFKRDKIE